jgi:hypothetical protein
MAAPVGLHADAQNLDKLVGDTLLSAGNISTNSGYAIYTNTNVTSADTVQGLRDVLTTAAAPGTTHADVQPVLARVNRAIDLGVADGSLTDARILSLTTVQGLVELTTAQITDGIVVMPPE